MPPDALFQEQLRLLDNDLFSAPVGGDGRISDARAEKGENKNQAKGKSHLQLVIRAVVTLDMKLFPGLTDVSLLYPLLQHLLRICLIVVGAFVATKIFGRWVPRLRLWIVTQMTRRAGPDVELEKRAATLGSIFRKTVNVSVWTVAVIMIFRDVGFDIGPILAGAGVIGLAVGFGA